MANYGVIYSAKSKMVRRIVVSDDPDYDYSIHVGPGENHLVAERTKDVNVFSARAIVKARTGVESPELVCNVVNQEGLIVDTIAADPDLDSVPGHSLVLIRS